MVFDGAYHMGSFSGAVCTPSRHMIMSGRTLWHLPIAPQAMKSAQQTIRDVVYGVYNGGTKPGMRSVKKGDWKLIKYDVLNGSVRETQLFNLKENPNEFIAHHHAPEVTSLTGVTPEPHQVNLATDPKHADKLAELEALLLDEMRRRNDPWRLWNQPSDGLANASDANAATIRKKK
jgi:choline-sulfatase